MVGLLMLVTCPSSPSKPKNFDNDGDLSLDSSPLASRERELLWCMT